MYPVIETHHYLFFWYSFKDYNILQKSWWRHQMETFSALPALCEGNPLVTGGFPSQRQATRSFGIFLSGHDWANNRDAGDLRKSRSLWRHCIGYILSRWLDNDVHWKYITLLKQMMILMKMMMMIMMIIWGLYIHNVISHIYIWYSKCQNVTHLNSWSSIEAQSLT